MQLDQTDNRALPWRYSGAGSHLKCGGAASPDHSANGKLPVARSPLRDQCSAVDPTASANLHRDVQLTRFLGLPYFTDFFQLRFDDAVPRAAIRNLDHVVLGCACRCCHGLSTCVRLRSAPDRKGNWKSAPRVFPASAVAACHCRGGRANVFLFRETALVHLCDERVNGEHDVQHVHGNKGKEHA